MGLSRQGVAAEVTASDPSLLISTATAPRLPEHPQVALDTSGWDVPSDPHRLVHRTLASGEAAQGFSAAGGSVHRAGLHFLLAMDSRYPLSRGTSFAGMTEEKGSACARVRKVLSTILP